MQSLNWNDLRFILAVSRGGTLAAAARMLRVDDSTVGRRLAAAQEILGGRLYQRLADGTLQLTTSGEKTLLHAERVEREIGLLGAAVSGEERSVSGTVRITSVPIVMNRILVPAARSFAERHPALRLELIADSRDLSLTRREADVALRLARPKTGGTRVIARCIGTIGYEVYAAASYSPLEANKLPWITYEDAMAHLPQARWIASRIGRDGEKVGSAHVNDAEGLVEAVAAGLGRSLLPSVVADRDPRLRRLGPKRRTPVVTRELWLMTHLDLRGLPRIEATVEWIEGIARRGASIG